MVLLISYDLNRYERSAAYREVAAAIERAAHDFRRPLASQWLVATDADALAWREYLPRYLDENDRLFICPVVQGYDGWLGGDVWEWLVSQGVSY
jgi:hypothetical protein